MPSRKRSKGRSKAWLTSATTEVSSAQGDGSLFETYARHFLRFFQTTERICDEVAIEQYKEDRLRRACGHPPCSVCALLTTTNRGRDSSAFEMTTTEQDLVTTFR